GEDAVVRGPAAGRRRILSPAPSASRDGTMRSAACQTGPACGRILEPIMTLDPAHCYEAVLSRDRRFDGRFFAGVVTTGVYCRPICPVKPARPQNVRWFACAAAPGLPAGLAGVRAVGRAVGARAGGPPPARGRAGGARGERADGGAVAVRLPHRPPPDGGGLVAALAQRAAAPVEAVADGVYR